MSRLDYCLTIGLHLVYDSIKQLLEKGTKTPMNKSLTILFAATLLSVWNAGIAWFTQIAVYPLWPFVDAAHFHDYHLAWWHDMWPSFAPVALMLLCSIALIVWPPPGVAKGLLWLGVLLQIVVHALTALFWAPIQASMATPSGMSEVKYAQLMGTHWIRVAFFFAYALLMMWLAAKALPSINNPNDEQASRQARRWQPAAREHKPS